MLFLKNNYFEFLIKALNNKDIESIFISSWDSIYMMSKDGYVKTNFSFDNEDDYYTLVEEVMIKYNNNCENELYINNYKNIDIHFYKWNETFYWTTLIKR